MRAKIKFGLFVLLVFTMLGLTLLGGFLLFLLLQAVAAARWIWPPFWTRPICEVCHCRIVNGCGCAPFLGHEI